MEQGFSNLETYLSGKLNADYLVIATIDDSLSPVTAKTLMVYSEGEYLDNFHYDLSSTPCEQVINSQICVYSDDVQSQFPDDDLLAEMGIVGYAGAPLRDKDGAVNGVLVALFGNKIRDPESVRVTLDTYSVWVSDEVNRLDAEWKLQESEKRFRATFELNPDAITITKIDDGTFVKVNNAFSELTGYSKEEVIGRPILDFNVWPNSEEREIFISRIKNEGTVYDVEFQLYRKNGTGIVGLMNSRIIDFDGEPHLLTIIKDITQLKQAWEELQAQKEELKVLRELLPICSYCKKIQDGEGYWEKVESYISRYTSASLSHGICPGCAREHFPQIVWDKEVK